MKYIIPEKRMIDLVGEFIKTIEPDFSKENVAIYRGVNTDEIRYIRYYSYNENGIFAKFFPQFSELQIEGGLFDKLKGIFSDEMEWVVQWFNREFEQEAEFLSRL